MKKYPNQIQELDDLIKQSSDAYNKDDKEQCERIAIWRKDLLKDYGNPSLISQDMLRGLNELNDTADNMVKSLNDHNTKTYYWLISIFVLLIVILFRL